MQARGLKGCFNIVTDSVGVGEGSDWFMGWRDDVG